MTTAISFANGKNGFCQVNSYCRNIHLDFPFLRFRLMDRNSILAHRCRLAYATSGMWEVPFIVVQIPRTERLRCALLQPFIGFRFGRERYPTPVSCDLNPSLKILVLSHGGHQDGELLLFKSHRSNRSLAMRCNLIPVHFSPGFRMHMAVEIYG